MLIALLLGAAEIAAEPPAPPADEGLPQAVYRMISVAARSEEDAADLDTVVDTAKLAYPEYVEEIDRLVAFLLTPVDEPDMLLTVTTAASAQRPRWSYFRDWGGRVALSGSASEGNSDASNLGLKLRLSRAEQGRIDRLDAYADTASNSSRTSQRRWGFAYQVDANITDGVHGYVRGSHDADAFSGFEHRSFLGAGLGSHFIDTQAIQLKGELGPGYQYTTLDDDKGSSGDWVLYNALLGSWQLDDSLSLEQEIRVTLSEPTHSLVSSSGLSYRVSRAIRTGVSYELRYESDPPEGNESRDALFRFNLSYGF